MVGYKVKPQKVIPAFTPKLLGIHMDVRMQELGEDAGDKE
jgi:hypothetical protein